MTLQPHERTSILELARRALQASLAGAPLPRRDDHSGILAECRGCFVTLKNAQRLRGCIGTFNPDAPLGELIVEMAHAAANDPRFTDQPVTAGELPQLTLEVSVLSPLQETDQPEGLRVGHHGIYIVRGGRAGCFLPEVATEVGWSASEFLSNCCAGKAGLPGDAWKDPQTKVYLFTSEKFSDSADV